MDSLYMDSVRWVQTLFADTHANEIKKKGKKITKSNQDKKNPLI